MTDKCFCLLKCGRQYVKMGVSVEGSRCGGVERETGSLRFFLLVWGRGGGLLSPCGVPSTRSVSCWLW